MNSRGFSKLRDAPSGLRRRGTGRRYVHQSGDAHDRSRPGGGATARVALPGPLSAATFRKHDSDLETRFGFKDCGASPTSCSKRRGEWRFEMLARRLSPTARLAAVAAVGLLALSSASYAGSQGQPLAGQAYDMTQPNPRESYFPHSAYPTSTPRDFSSSDECINGYRWITRDYHIWEPPAEWAIPVRC